MKSITAILAVMLVVVVLGTACYPADPETCGMTTGVWQPGMYWTHEASSSYHTVTGCSKNEGTVMFLALARTSWLGLETWALAALWRWVDGANGISLFNYQGMPGSPVRWPLIADALPGALTTTSRSALTLTMATEPVTYSSGAVRVERVSGSVEGGSVAGCAQCSVPAWLEDAGETDFSLETLTLIPGDSVVGDVCLARDYTLKPVKYEWTGLSVLHVGEALWSPNLEWWVSAEGHEEWDDGTPILDYQVELSACGVFDTTELLRVLETAVGEMAASKRPATDCIRHQLQTLGLVAE